MHAGLYVPLICMGEELGMLCVENTEEESEFSPEQLAGVMAVAQLAAVHLQHRLARETGNESSG
jgi:GAF domain-containing protein